MPSTPIYGLPYPSRSDGPDVPAQMKSLADSVETELSVLNSKSIPVVSSTGAISNPYNGQLIYNSTDNMLYRYKSTGSTWVAFQYADEGGYAFYYESVAHTMFNAAETRVPYDLSTHTTTDITASDGNRNFTINRAGVWAIETSHRWAFHASGARAIIIKNVNGGLERYAAATVPANAFPQISTQVTKRFNAGQTISIITYQDAGTNINSWPDHQANHVSFTWLRP